MHRGLENVFVGQKVIFDTEYPNVASLARALGVRRLARLLAITDTELRKARSGESPLPALVASRARDLDIVLARALQVFNEKVIVNWLEGTEPTYGFARPIDIFCVRGKDALLDVLDRIDSGGYA